MAGQGNAWVEDYPQHPGADAGVEEQRLYVDAGEVWGQGIFENRQAVGVQRQQMVVFVDGGWHCHCCYPQRLL
ncbi:hypothetical protein D3C86_2237390 [compost metagenome]